MENVRNRIRIEIIKQDDIKNIIKQQSKLTFNGIRKSNENCDSYTFQQNDVVMDNPIYLGFGALELRRYRCMRHIMMNYNRFLVKKIFIYTMFYTDAFVLSRNTKDIIKDLKNFGDIFDFSNLNENL